MLEEYRKIKAMLMSRTIQAAANQKVKPTGLENPSYKIVKEYPNTYNAKVKKLVGLKYNPRKKGR